MIYVCIPAHDEQRTIGVLLWKVRKVMGQFERDFEILVLDDASSDDTPGVLARYAGRLPLHVIRTEERLGYGPAMERLLREAVDRSPYPKRDVAVTLQGDFSENPEDLVPMVKTIEGGADLVAGSLSVDRDLLPHPLRFARWAAPRLLGRTFRGAPVEDPLSGFRAHRLVVVKKALRELDQGRTLVASRGWGANLELLSKLAPHARRIEDSPYEPSRIPRDRPTRFRAVRDLWSLVGLRGTSWPSREDR